MILNLADKSKTEIDYKEINFSDTQYSIVLDTRNTYEHVTIKSRMTWGDIQRIACAVSALKGIADSISLYVPYFLGGRSDRKFEPNSPHYLRDVVCPIINSLGFKSVTVLDPHSDVIEACLDNVIIKNNENLLMDAVGYYGLPIDAVWVAPDKGASKKIYALARSVNYEGRITVCEKERDLQTGHIIKTVVPVENFEGKDVVIIDDICDGGRTFYEICKAAQNYGNAYLVVTHGIFSRGFSDLEKYFTKIYTTNSIERDVDSDILVEVDVF